MTLFGITAPAGQGPLVVEPCRAGDLDGDGLEEFAIGRPQVNNRDGMVEIRSGRNAAVIRRLYGPAGAAEYFGSTINALSDLDGDGHPELLVCSSSANRRGQGRVGRVDIFASRDQRLLRTLYGLGDGDLFGRASSGLGDLDGDGVPDFAIGAPENGNAAQSYGPGYVRVFSGRDFRELQFHDGVTLGDEFGSSIASIPDIDGDGVTDYMIGALLEVAPGSGQGSARVYSGATGQVVHTWRPPVGTDHFGLTLGALGDRDGDGVIELFVTSIGMTSPDTGAIALFNSVTGELIERVWADGNAGVFGHTTATPGDVTGDGIPDLVIGDPMARQNGTRRGAYHIVSGADLSIVTTSWGPPGNAGYGLFARTVGDLDADGRPELAIGYPGYRRADGSLGWRVEILSVAGDIATPGLGCSPGPSAPRLDSTGARVGSSLPLWIGGGTQTAGMGVVLISARPDLPLALPFGLGDCSLYVDPLTAGTAATVTTNASGRGLGWLAIPGDPALGGAELALQAVILTPAGMPEFTQGLYLRVRD